jgi:D-alanyl-D-alanine carboxypeptidase
MRADYPHPARRNARNKLTAAAAACALLGAAGLLSSSAASASARPARESSATLRKSLHRDLSRYLTARRTAEHISAVSLRVTFRGSRRPISLAAGTNRYDGGPAAAARALWQIGSNTKAFTAVILLRLEAEGKLSINDPIGKWLPQYPAWRHITIRRLLDMTSRLPDYLHQPAFAAALTADPRTRFTAARLVSYADQLTRRIITPLRLRSTCLAPGTCPRADAARMPAGYFFEPGAPPLLGEAMPRLALSWAQGAGGIVSSLADVTTWDRDLYQGQVLPPRQQRQLESLVSQATGKPIRRTTLADPAGYGLGVAQSTTRQSGTIWYYEGGSFGNRVMHLYFPRSGMIITLAANSAVDPADDDLGDLAGSVYQALLKAGAVHTG